MTTNNLHFYTLNDLMTNDSKVMINGELELKPAIAEWINIASSLKLKNILHYYHQFIEHHIDNLESCFTNGKLNGLAYTDLAMKSLIQMTNEKLEKCSDPEIKDACLLASVQKIIHHKICFYGTAMAYAKALESEKYQSVFMEADNDEKQIDKRLTELAEKEINVIAKAPILIEP